MTPQALAMLAVLALGIGFHLRQNTAGRAIPHNTPKPAGRSALPLNSPGRPASFSVIEGGRRP